jgi:EpsI family protein
LVFIAVPIALITNATRVLLTGIATYRFGAGVIDSWWHDAFGWLTFFAALALLLVANLFIGKLFFKTGPNGKGETSLPALDGLGPRGVEAVKVAALFAALVLGGALINWFQVRTETPVPRRPLDEFPVKFGEAFRPAPDRRFSPATEEVLGATDYIMRDYIAPPRRFNLYVGYYASQRTGATYHSPQHCLPGSGWEISNGAAVEFFSPSGKRIFANRYVVQNGKKRHIMIYWYQGRGRTNGSEYWDKLYTIADSVTKGRSDGAMARVLTPVYAGETDDTAFVAATEFSGIIADSLNEYVPD